MADVDELYDAIEKARGLIAGGSSRMRLHVDRVEQRAKRAKLKATTQDAAFDADLRQGRVQNVAAYLSSRRSGGYLNRFKQRRGSYK